MEVKTTMTRDQISDEARRFGLAPGEIEDLTMQTVPGSINVTSYAGNERGQRFLEHLCTKKMATKIR